MFFLYLNLPTTPRRNYSDVNVEITPRVNLIRDEIKPSVLEDGGGDDFQSALLRYFKIKRFERLEKIVRAEQQSFVRHQLIASAPRYARMTSGLF